MSGALGLLLASIQTALGVRVVWRLWRTGRDAPIRAVPPREIEPLGYVGKGEQWYLVGWCRLRGGLRVFRTDRITAVCCTAEVPAPRALRREDLDIPAGAISQLTLS